MIVDALGRELALASPPRRIVSLVPSLTEFLFVIGAGELVVGVTDYCSEPAEAVTGLAKVRGTKNPDRAAIADLRPDLVLAAREENRRRDVDALEAAGIPVYVTDICSVNDAAAQLEALSRLVGAAAQAAPLLDELRLAIAEAQAAQAGRPARRTLAFIWRDPWMAVGAETYAGDLLRMCGAENLALELGGRYPRADLERFMALDPQAILLPDEPYVFAEADIEAFAPFPASAAVRDGRIHLCDGKLLTWYGPRTAAALRLFTRLLY